MVDTFAAKVWLQTTEQVIIFTAAPRQTPPRMQLWPVMQIQRDTITSTAAVKSKKDCLVPGANVIVARSMSILLALCHPRIWQLVRVTIFSLTRLMRQTPTRVQVHGSNVVARTGQARHAVRSAGAVSLALNGTPNVNRFRQRCVQVLGISVTARNGRGPLAVLLAGRALSAMTGIRSAYRKV